MKNRSIPLWGGLFLGFALAAATAAADAVPQEPTLRSASKGLFEIGVGINDRIPERPQDWPLLNRQFSIVTPENCLKPAAVQAEPERFDFALADRFVQFAVSNQLQVVGHCLVWAKDDRTPEWFYRDGTNRASRELLLDRMTRHIATVVGRYRGRVKAWDVVNEALDDGTNFLRPSGWSAACGEEFIVKAFQAAHAADPEALLIYNDYNNELPEKRAKMIRLVRLLRERQVPIHAVGLQGHYEIDRVPLKELEATFLAARELGVKVVISELDLDVIPRGRWWADGGKHREELAKLDPYREGCPPDVLQKQADQYAAIFRLLRQHADVISRVSFWNLHDGQSWLNYFPWRRVNYPLLFDREGQPKPAFHSVLRALTTASLSGELKCWHKVTLSVPGPFAKETDERPNPFTDYRMTVTFRHESGSLEYRVPGYFAADGQAAETSATSGNVWRAHLCPDKPGRWTYRVSFVAGDQIALDPSADGKPVAGVDGSTGTFDVGVSDKSGRDFRSQGRLEYVGKHHLRFAQSGEYFLKAGADAPENLLAFADFDGTSPRRQGRSVTRPGEAAAKGLHQFQPHVADWRTGDPTWKNGLGKGLIGAINYLSGAGANAFSFLTYNVGGDGDDVWPFREPQDKLHYDCSKLDQWQIVFDHAQARGLFLHFKLQETENDDNRLGKEERPVPAALDGGDLGPERKLYRRELVARFGYELALNWNLGEENTQSASQQRAMAQYLDGTDPYHHPIVVHTYPDWQDRVYPQLVGSQSALAGASLQNSWNAVHERTLKWLRASQAAGKPWVVANDEQNPPDFGVPPDPAYLPGDLARLPAKAGYNLHGIRKYTLWGNLMAGGAGVEYYFGYRYPHNDLGCEDWKSRAQSWEYCRIALEFFAKHKIPFWEMESADALVGNKGSDNSRYCLTKRGELYVVYLPQGGRAELDLEESAGGFTVGWFNPRSGGELRSGEVTAIRGPGRHGLGQPPDDPEEDWAILITRR